MAIRILIADDHTLFRAGLRMLASDVPDFQVVGEAADGEAALRQVADLLPDILLADVSMPPPTGIELAACLRELPGSPRVIIVTAHEDPALAAEAQRAGASGYLTKRALESELVGAIRTVSKGTPYWQLAPAETKPLVHEDHATPAVLTDAERQLLRLVASGFPTEQVARMLGQRPETVEQSRLLLMQKLGLRSRTSLIRFAHDHDLI